MLRSSGLNPDVVSPGTPESELVNKKIQCCALAEGAMRSLDEMFRRGLLTNNQVMSVIGIDEAIVEMAEVVLSMPSKVITWKRVAKDDPNEE